MLSKVHEPVEKILSIPKPVPELWSANLWINWDDLMVWTTGRQTKHVSLPTFKTLSTKIRSKAVSAHELRLPITLSPTRVTDPAPACADLLACSMPDVVFFQIEEAVT